MQSQSRREFLNVAALFEGGLLLVAIVVAELGGFDYGPLLYLTVSDLLWGLLAVLPMLGGFYLASSVKDEVTELLGASLAACRWHDLAALGLLAGLGEELLFRGVLQWSLGGWGAWAAVITVNLAFGLAHAMSWLYFVFAFIVGIYFSWLFTGLPGVAIGPDSPSLIRPIIAHAVYDFIAFMLIAREYRDQHRHDDDDLTSASGRVEESAGHADAESDADPECTGEPTTGP
ncbi:MAG: CPBP family intramembrane glutamic endopeptidase [Planctomycetaceae bacterium]